mgnify:FL=1
MVKSKNYTFSTLFSSSLTEYKQNYKQFAKFIFITVGIVLFLTAIWQFYFVLTDESAKIIIENPSLIAQGNVPSPTWAFGGFILALASIVLTIFMQAGFIRTVVSEKKFANKTMIANAKKHFGKYLGFFIVFMIFMMLLILALIIPAIIFGVFWIFASFIFLEDKGKKGIINSLKKSFQIVKNNWWKTLGYILLLMLIYLVFNFLLRLIFTPFFLAIASIFQTSNIAIGLNYFLSTLNQLIATIIATPFSILFFKNFYMARKEELGIK